MKHLRFTVEVWLHKLIDVIKSNWYELIDRIKSNWYELKYGISNLIKYFKVIWQDRNYDFGYIYLLLDKKLELIENRYESHYLFEHQENTLKYIKLVRKLINMSLNEYYSMIYFNLVFKGKKPVNNRSLIEIKVDKLLEKNYKKIYDKYKDKSIKSRRIYITNELDKKSNALLWKIISNKIGSWWD